MMDKAELKNTLNLPQTTFPMKANLALRELETLQYWDQIQLYTKLRQYSRGQAVFSLLDGPPYANGHLHLGHAVNKILKDIILKSKTFAGFDTPFTPGWDCHGLPIELNVEKMQAKEAQTPPLTASQFRQACRDYASTQITVQRSEFIRLGVIADWKNPYCTMDFTFEAHIMRSIAQMIAKKYIQLGFKPVHWCLSCASALAEAEVEYQEKKSLAIDVRFTIVDLIDFYHRLNLSETNSILSISIPIWTTTPWTLPANQAVALNKTAQYVLIQHLPDAALLIAEDLLIPVLQRYRIQQYQRLGHTIGERLEGVQLHHPLNGQQIPVILSQHVTLTTGTGAVHVAPAHGTDDFLLGQQYALPLHSLVDGQGKFAMDTPMVGGMHVTQVNAVILSALTTQQKLLHQETILHSYPHCWRHKIPLIFRATPQWFITMDSNKLRAAALTAITQIQWEPRWGAERMHNMIASRPDWCISRQRTWGVPLPIFIHRDTGQLHPRTVEWIEVIAKQVEIQGTAAWYQLDPTAFLNKKEAVYYIQVTDVLDVWFDSGVVYECVPKQYPSVQVPADLCLEGSDQYRGWFQSLLLTAIALRGSPPYRAILTHGFVVDGEGRKMSKSVGNVIAPNEIIRTLGADVLRLWVASVDYRSEMHISTEILLRTTEMYRRIRNTIRFLLANLHDFIPEKHLRPITQLLLLDHWILSQAQIVQQEVIEWYEQFQFHPIIHKLHHFCVNDLGGFYLAIIKDRQYTMAQNNPGRRSAQTVLWHILQALIRWASPILSFTAEEAWQHLKIMQPKQADSIFLNRWYKAWPQADLTLLSTIDWASIHLIREAVNKEIERQRNIGQIGSGLEAEIDLYCSHPHLTDQLTQMQAELHFLFMSAAVQVLPEMKASTIDLIQTEIEGVMITIRPTKQAKCERCWHRCADVGHHLKYPNLCKRCIINVFGNGEIRQFA